MFKPEALIRNKRAHVSLRVSNELWVIIAKCNSIKQRFILILCVFSHYLHFRSPKTKLLKRVQRVLVSEFLAAFGIDVQPAEQSWVSSPPL